MTVERLDNERWGFATNCFVCEPGNDHGLRIPFSCDTEARVVFAEFTLDDRFSGAPTWVHGGISLAICDEAMAWAAIALEHRWAVTASTQASFPRPVRIGRPYRVEARVTAADDDRIHTEARITDADGKVRVDARAELAVYSAVRAPEMLGTEVPEQLRSYLRDDPTA